MTRVTSSSRRPPRRTESGLAVAAGLVESGVDLLEHRHADDLHVATRGDRLHAVLGLARPDRPEAGPESEEVLGDLHPRGLRRGSSNSWSITIHDDGRHDDQHVEAVEHHGERRPPPRRTRGAAGDLVRAGRVSSVLAAGWCSTRSGFWHASTTTAPRRGVGGEDVHDLDELGRLVAGQRRRGDRGDPRPAQLPGEEGRHGDLLGGVQPGRRALPGPPRLESEVEAGNRPRGRAGRTRAARPPPVNPAERLCEPLPRSAAACRAGTAGRWFTPSRNFDHRVHDRLRVDDNLDACRTSSPNSSCASITSRPLFMSVEESTVIFGPICQVGWARASSTVTAASSSAPRPERTGRRSP